MNWTLITSDDLKANAYGGLVDAAQALAAGANDPVGEAIADAVSTVRGAIATGNQLDTNAGKVPNSLRSLTARLAVFALMERLQVELNVDQRATRQGDQARLNRISEQRIRFETPDTAGGAAEMQAGAGIETVARGNWGNDRKELRGI
jgi:hypothetical protein